ncbi:MAG: phosphate-starvation-inducible PsiE family protein [Desulfobacterales bacterium]|nr:phosphate-starvation-inducible PsiE family protein [Desulfobacterales bacterium]
MTRMPDYLRRFSRGVVLALILMMMFTVAVSTVELLVILVQELLAPPAFLLGIDNLFAIFGFFMMILIALELLESIRAYLTDDSLHVEVVFLVAMIAIARKVIILEVRDLDPLRLVGIAAIILALSVGYYFVKRAMSTTHHSARHLPE